MILELLSVSSCWRALWPKVGEDDKGGGGGGKSSSKLKYKFKKNIIEISKFLKTIIHNNTLSLLTSYSSGHVKLDFDKCFWDIIYQNDSNSTLEMVTLKDMLLLSYL